MPLYPSRFSYTPETWARLIGNPFWNRIKLLLCGRPIRHT